MRRRKKNSKAKQNDDMHKNASTNQVQEDAHKNSNILLHMNSKNQSKKKVQWTMAHVTTE